MANDVGLIKQSERLFTVRSRGYALPQSDGGSRGVRARINLLSNDPNKSIASRKFSSLDHDGNNPFDKLLSKDPGVGFEDFILTDVNVSFNEKVQITQTFGDTETVYYFGKAPVIYNISGLIIDDLDNQWFARFMETYASIIRGTETARNYELVELILPNVEIIGSVMSFSYSQNSQRDTDIPFNMQVHAKSIIPIPVRMSGQIPINSAQLIDFGKAANFTTFKDINKVKAKSDFVGDLPLAESPLDRTRDITSSGARLFKGDSGNITSPAAFNATIFSPVFGVLTTITKVVKTTTGDISKIISSFTNPVNSVLRDIQGISTQAIGIVRAVEAGVGNIVNQPLQTLTQLRNTIISLKNAAGVISRMPETISQSIKRLTKFGKINSSAAFLTAGGTKPKSKISIINSGQPYSPASGGALRR